MDSKQTTLCTDFVLLNKLASALSSANNFLNQQEDLPNHACTYHGQKIVQKITIPYNFTTNDSFTTLVRSALHITMSTELFKDLAVSRDKFLTFSFFGSRWRNMTYDTPLESCEIFLVINYWSTLTDILENCKIMKSVRESSTFFDDLHKK